MTPAEKRIKDQIDRWLASLDLHLQYVDLNDLAYNRVQPWPVHDRPTKLVLELAKQKTLELKAAVDARIDMDDGKFADALELMQFLANLIGSQHVQRFIPLADPERATPSAPAAPPPPQQTKAEPKAQPASPAPAAKAPAEKPATPKPTARPEPVANPPSGTMTSNTMAPTIIMPHNTPSSAAATKKPVTDDDATREMPRPQRKTAAQSPAPTPAASKAAKPEAKKSGGKNEAASQAHLQVITDAVRLLNWGRPWHELAEAIARMADRPSAGEIRRILRAHRADIERRAAQPQ